MNLSHRDVNKVQSIHSQTFIKIFEKSVVPELNIYGQAFLENDRPMILASLIHPMTSYESGVSFNIEGDISGSVFCLVDIFDKNIKTEERDFFKSLFQESMNILLGQMLTKIETQSDLLAVITNPKESNINNTEEIINQNNIKLSTGYKLICLGLELNCRIVFNINKQKL